MLRTSLLSACYFLRLPQVTLCEKCSHTRSRAVPSALRGLTFVVCAASEPRGAIPSGVEESLEIRSGSLLPKSRAQSRDLSPQKKKAIQISLNGFYFYAGDDRSLP